MGEKVKPAAYLSGIPVSILTEILEDLLHSTSIDKFDKVEKRGEM